MTLAYFYTLNLESMTPTSFIRTKEEQGGFHFLPLNMIDYYSTLQKDSHPCILWETIAELIASGSTQVMKRLFFGVCLSVSQYSLFELLD